MKIVNGGRNKIKYFKGEFLHPSLDVKDNLLILGFRFICEDLKEKEFFIITTNEGIRIYQDNYFDLEKKKYFIETKGRLLVRIEEKWDLEELNNFINDYNSTKVKTLTLKELFQKIKEKSRKITFF